MKGFLLVRSHGVPYGLPLQEVLEVFDEIEAEGIPGGRVAVRGVSHIRERLVPVVNLGTLLRGETPPDREHRTVVLARCLGKRVALEVDDAEEVVRDQAMPVPTGPRLPWATGLAQWRGEMVPIVNLDVVGQRLEVADE